MPTGKFPGYMHGMRHGHIDGVPYFRFWCQKTLPALYDDSLSYYDLLTNVVWYINQLITVAKAYDEKFCELEGLYIELEHYVASYFDKLDVEQTVADILNDMAYSGRLTEIMTTYINDYSIDAKKIKNGFVPVHYEYVKCDENNDYYKRDLTDKEMVEALRHGSVLLGFFNGSPQFGNFIMFMDTFEYDYNGKTIECPCGCCCEHLVQNYKVTYKQAMANKNGKLIQYIVTDEYCKQYAVGYYGKMYADVEDGSITAEKLADGAVTHPKLADDAVWENNIKDGEVTPRKLGKGNIVMLADVYDLDHGGWTSRLARNLGLKEYSETGCTCGCGCGRDCPNYHHEQCYKVKAKDGAGFVGNNDQTFLKSLQELAGEVDEAFRLNTSYILVGGGNDDRGKPKNSVADAIVTFAQYVRQNFPNATVIVAQCSWRDSVKAGGGRGAYITVTREYTVGCGKAGFRFVKNSPFALHDYELLDSEGWKPNEDGCEEIAVMFGIELAGGTYDKLGDWRQLAYTVDDKVIIGDDAQNHLFPGDVPDPKPPVMWNYMHNDSVYVWLSFHTIEFKNPTNLIGHLPNGENGETGQFRLLQFNNPSGYIQPVNNSDFKNFPVTVVDSDGNVRNATLCIRHGASEILCFLYRGKEKQTSHDVGVEFDVFENTKYIHFGAAFGKFKIDAFDC